MSHFPSMCCSSPLNPQVLFYDCHDSHFDDRELDILCKHNIQSFILKADDSVHEQPNYKGPKTNIKNMYGSSRTNWMRHHGNLKLTPDNISSVLVVTWEALKISSMTINSP